MLWLEAKRVPYAVRKATMFCYGEKEAWYTKLVPSGMLPALQLTPAGPIITESDDIMCALERAHGPLGQSLSSPVMLPLRKLERALFRAWCSWLCRPATSPAADAVAAAQFSAVASSFADALLAKSGPFLLGSELSVADVVFVPFVERMRASLFYYKAFDITAAFPPIRAWFAALEAHPAYAGMMADFHTHAHDLPPQLGGCYEGSDAAAVAACAALVDRGPWAAVPEVCGPAPAGAVEEAVRRCAKHRATLALVNADRHPGRFDEALRAVLTSLLLGSPVQPPAGSALGLRALRDQISVPRDMGVHAARALRQVLEDTAALDSDAQPPPLPTRHRRDQNAIPFSRFVAPPST